MLAVENPMTARNGYLLDLVRSVSNADPAHAQRLVDAYEVGLKRIEASGELRRIRAYYGISERP